MTLPHLNGVRFDSLSPRPHVESYFIKLNDPEGRRALWLKATIFAPADNPGKAEAEAWAIAFDRETQHVAAKAVTPFSGARFSMTGLDVDVAGFTMREGKVSGRVENGGHAVDVDLAFTHDAAPLVQYPAEAMYRLPLPKSKLVTPHPDSLFTGHFIVDGHRVSVDGWRGMQGHNWGSEHAALYAWSHCNQWEKDADVMFEGLTGRIALGPVLAPPLTLVFIRYQGRTYAFNGAWTMIRARGEIGIQDLSWRFKCENSQGVIEGRMSGERDDFVGLYYRNPGGKMTYCLNTKIARANLVFTPRGGRALELSTNAAALELATLNAEHPVKMYV